MLHWLLTIIAAITPTLKRDSYTSQHVNYYLREVRIVAYSQFLESYRSVTLSSMAKAFGVTEAFLDTYVHIIHPLHRYRR
jgi:26S proteasome regulatory subunit N7